MKNAKFILVLLGVFLLNSCFKEKSDYQTSGKYIKVGGIVVDMQNTPIKNVTVTIGNKIVETDDNGIFYIDNVLITEDKYFVKFNKDGYLPNYKSGIATSGSITLKVILISNADVTNSTFNTAAGGNINLSGGGELYLPPNLNYVVEKTGEAYTGEVYVISYYVNPTQSNFLALMPGGQLWGLKNSELKKLFSYGGLFIRLLDPSGRKLNLSKDNDNSAVLRIPIPTAFQSDAPDSISFWSNDFNKSFCMLAGSGSRDQDKYVAEVKHFSYWRTAQDFDEITKYIGTVRDENGVPVSGINIIINDMYFSRTNSEGKYFITAPKGLPNPTIKINPNEYAGIPFQETIQANTNSSVVTHNITLPLTQIIEGKILCNNTLKPAFVKVSYQNQQGYEQNVYTIASNGEFRTFVPQTLTNADIHIITNYIWTETITLSGSSDSINSFIFDICSNYNYLRINNTNISLLEVYASFYTQDKLAITFLSNDDKQLLLYFIPPSTANQEIILNPSLSDSTIFGNNGYATFFDSGTYYNLNEGHISNINKEVYTYESHVYYNYKGDFECVFSDSSNQQVYIEGHFDVLAIPHYPDEE